LHFLITESEQHFGFPHIPNIRCRLSSQVYCTLATKQLRLTNQCTNNQDQRNITMYTTTDPL